MLLRAVLLCPALLFAFTSGADAASCKADFDGSGSVDVSEVIQAVNEALNGCDGAQPTPTKKGAKTPTPTKTPTEPPAPACPYRFNQAVTADRFCGYGGSLSDNCGNGEAGVGSGWTTSNNTVVGIVVDSSGMLGVYATRTGPTTGTVSGIAFGPDFDTLYQASGSIALPTAQTFNVDVNDGATCGVLSSRGTFTQLLGDSSKAVWSPLQQMAERHVAAGAARSEASNALAGETRALADQVQRVHR
jgi:hypothetical protein